ncbi:MAG: 2-phosphosulfolactate phosphatase [Bacteroidota bacterium]|nr:2-phosphosulfolactate phosphatase [Bacteroidota bacterium]
MIFDQSEFDVRLEWGFKGVEELASISDVVIIVDVLSFSTSIDIATNNGAIVFPYYWKNESVVEYSKSVNAILADSNRKSPGNFSLSPSSLINISSHTRLVLPSPNGSELSLSTGNTITLCGCLRNAKSVSEYAMKAGNKIAVIPAGEKWKDNSLRPAFEDLVGAGAIISYLKGNLSPESKSALSIFLNSKENLFDEIKQCSSGKELIARGFECDVDLACELNKSSCVPVIVDRSFINLSIKIL